MRIFFPNSFVLDVRRWGLSC